VFCVSATKHILAFIYSVSEWFCLRICRNGPRSPTCTTSNSWILPRLQSCWTKISVAQPAEPIFISASEVWSHWPPIGSCCYLEPD